jgi:hypothetical protein
MSPRVIFILQSLARQNELPIYQRANCRPRFRRFKMKFSHKLKLTFLLFSGLICPPIANSHDG